MARTDTTRIAVLGVVAVEPASGIAIRESIAETIGHFWSESFGQIYPTLAALEDEAFIEVVRRAGREKVYGITHAGLAELQGLLGQDITQAPARDVTLLRLFFGRFLGPDACQRTVRRVREECASKTHEFADLRRALEQQSADQPDGPYWLITLRSGELAVEAKMRWAEETLAALDELGRE